jgi:GT2 family glycosyltransferase
MTAILPARPAVRGKFLYAGDEKLYVRGVTYGTFRPDHEGNEFREEDVERDFAAMVAAGVNAVRTYSVPPRWLLDTAAHHGLRVMVGLPWEQHVTFLDDDRRVRSIEERVRAGVRACEGHPAVLCYVVGNEIPTPIVRWHGRRPIERFVERLYRAAKSEDPDGLVAYVNYPSTEYLSLPFVDLVCFNVYLEERQPFAAYLARLQKLAGDKPLVIAEVGLDSRRHGLQRQAEVLDWQIRTSFAAGCAGVFAYAWTDEWHRGGFEITDWDFGLTDRTRRPKPALGAVRAAFADVPLPPGLPWPSVSVVVCTHNGAATLSDTLSGLRELDYPRFEVIVVDDGSTDSTAAVAAAHGVRLVQTQNQGLAAARNEGTGLASGEIVAFVDDDAWPDPHWLRYLAATFIRRGHAAVGGPNIPPPDDGLVAACVALAPGGPIHVLLSDEEAEHIPGCNMAVRKSCLEAIGGFDPQFRAAGDDVDVCWRLQEHGWTLGFSPAAVVWHRRRRSVRAYWRQQESYGRAEALLERKWPARYNALGHVSWRGRVYGGGLAEAIARRVGRIYHGTWGTAPFQSLYQPAPGLLRSLPLMPEWYLGIVALAGLAAIGLLWTPLLAALPLLGLALIVPLVQTLVSAATLTPPRRSLRTRLLVAALHGLQPLARLSGRVRYGLTPWRRRGARALAWPWPHTTETWSEAWVSLEDRLRAVEAALRVDGAPALRGGDFDRWDLEMRGGMFGSARLLTTVEEHGQGRQLVRFLVRPRLSPLALACTAASAAIAAGAALSGAWAAFGLLVALTGAFALAGLLACAVATGNLLRAVDFHAQAAGVLADALRASPPDVAQSNRKTTLPVSARSAISNPAGASSSVSSSATTS